MKFTNLAFGLTLIIAILEPRAQTYTEEDVDTYLYPISWFNFQNGRIWDEYIGASDLPANFQYTRVVGISLVVLRDPNSSGQLDFISPLFRLYRFGGRDPAVNGAGGAFKFECTTTPYCFLTLDRGMDDVSFFNNPKYSRTDVNRLYLKIDYLR